MTKRSVSEILRLLSKDVGDLAKVAQELDQCLGQLDLHPSETANLVGLQEVDRLSQHLMDVAAILSEIARQNPMDLSLDVDRVTSVVQLDDFRNRLAGTNSAARPVKVSGTVDLF